MKLLFLCLFILASLLAIRFVFYFQNIVTYKVGDSFQAEVTLLSDPRHGDYSQTFKAHGITVQAQKYPRYGYGDKLYIQGVISDNTFETENGKTVTQLVVKDPKIQRLPNNNLFINTASFVRGRVQRTFHQYLPKNEAVLLFGIVFGGSSGFSNELYEKFQAAGVLHVIAASGMNVSIFAGFLFAIFASFLKRQHALLISITGIFYYALISGLSASVMRAAIMGSIVFAAALYGRKSWAILSLILTSFLMLFVSPGILFDVGFQLSITATLGILLVKPLFDKIQFVKKTGVVSDDITTSISAQLGSIPIMIGTFSTYSLISILVNALVLWTIPFLMILGGIAALCSITVPFVSVPFLYLAYPLLAFFEKVVVIFGNVPLLQVPSISIVFWIGYYLILFSLIGFISQKSKHEI